MTGLLRQQLVAARESAKALAACVDAALAALEPPPPAQGGPCQHPPEKRVTAARMGAPGAWVCQCGAEGEG